MKNPSPSPFGSLLREYRLAAGLSQETLAERAHISVETVSALERGTRRAPRPDTVALLAGALELDHEGRTALIRAASRARLSENASPPDSGVMLASGLDTARHTGRWTLPQFRTLWKTLLATGFAIAVVVVISSAAVMRGRPAAVSRPKSSRLRLVSVWAPPATHAFTLEQPRGIALEPRGTLVVADYAQGTLARITSDGHVLGLLGGPGPEPGQFIRPTAVAIDRKGNIFVADTGNNRIQELSAQGSPIRQWSTQASLQEPLSQPAGVAVDDGGNIVIADSGNARLLQIDPSGNLLWAKAVSARAVAVDHQGLIHVLVATNPFSWDGLFIEWFLGDGRSAGSRKSEQGTPGDRPRGPFWPYWQIAIDGKGVEYVTNGSSPGIRVFHRNGHSSVLAPAVLGAPGGIAVDGEQALYVTDVATRSIVRVSPTAHILARWHTLQPVQTPFRAPSGVAVDRNGDVYVADSGNDRIEKLSPQGQLIRVWSGMQHGQQIFAYPRGIAIDARGRMYIADFQEHAVDVVAPDGHRIVSWTRGPHSPAAITLDRRGNAYVVGDRAVRELSRRGRVLNQWIGHMTGIAVDGKGILYLVADSPSITKMKPDGQTVAVVATGSAAIHSVALGPAGRLYALDMASTSTLRVLSQTGDLVQTLGGRGSKPGTFSGPQSVAVDRQGRVYVADTGNDRIEVFAPG